MSTSLGSVRRDGLAPSRGVPADESAASDETANQENRMTFTLDKARKFDASQVKGFLPEFTEIHEAMMLESGRSFSYNDDFIGRIPGIAGPDEGTAIYLLQGLYRLKQEERQIAELLGDGFFPIVRVFGTEKFDSVVVWERGYYSCGTGKITRYEGARVVGVEEGKPAYILPRRARTRGYRLSGNAWVYVRGGGVPA